MLVAQLPIVALALNLVCLLGGDKPKSVLFCQESRSWGHDPAYYLPMHVFVCLCAVTDQRTPHRENNSGYCDGAWEKKYWDGLHGLLTCCSGDCTAALLTGVAVIALDLLQQQVEYIGYRLVLFGRCL